VRRHCITRRLSMSCQLRLGERVWSCKHINDQVLTSCDHTGTLPVFTECLKTHATYELCYDTSECVLPVVDWLQTFLHGSTSMFSDVPGDMSTKARSRIALLHQSVCLVSGNLPQKFVHASASMFQMCKCYRHISMHCITTPGSDSCQL